MLVLGERMETGTGTSSVGSCEMECGAHMREREQYSQDVESA